MPDTPLASQSSPLTALLGQLVELGGPAMIVLIAIAVIGLVAFFYLILFGSVYAPRMTRSIRQSLDKWQKNPSLACPEQLEQQAGSWARRNPLHQLVTGAMRTHLGQQDPQQAREIVARDAGKALEPFEAPLKIIEVIAALAPLLGLLGTVLGMMEAFSTMAAAEGRASASQLSGGIYQALTTTAAGLVVAIPFAALAAWIEFRLRRLQGTLNSVLVEILSGSLPDNISTDPATDSLNEPALGESQGDAPGASHRQSTAQPATQEVDWQGHQTAANAVR